jgi:hypothetical protein
MEGRIGVVGEPHNRVTKGRREVEEGEDVPDNTSFGSCRTVCEGKFSEVHTQDPA